MAARGLLRRPSLGAWLAAAVVVSTAAACGSRGPLLDDPVSEDDGGSSADGTSDGPGPDGAKSDASSDATQEAEPQDAGHDPSPFDCPTCLAQQCGQQVAACLFSTTCRTALQCAATKCLSGGQPNLQCILGCTNNDPQVLKQIFDLFTCVIGKCGADCAALLGGGGMGG